MLEQIEKEELLGVVNGYVSKSEFYQEKYSALSVDDFESIPFVTKQELLEDQQNKAPFGSNLCVDKSEILRIHRTSGTTNKPLLIALTKNDIDTVTDIGAELFRLTGMNERDTVINCLNYNMWMGGYTDHQSMEKTGAAVIPFGTGNTDNLISLMQDLHEASIHCTPSYLSVIKKKLSAMDMSPKDLGLKNGFFAAEGGIENKSFRGKIEKEWEINAYNANYGLSEVISILGSECNKRDGLHFGALSALYVELVDKDLNTIDIVDGAEGELVITHLKKEAQPLIRYRTGDIFKIISVNSCSCGFKGFKFKISGRIDDMVVIKGVNFFPQSIRSILSKHREFSGVYKVVVSKQEPIDSVKIVVELKVTETDLEELHVDLVHEIKSQLNISVELEFVEQLEFSGNKMKLLERV